MAIYLKADGINGNVSTQGYQGWVEINKFRFNGISQTVEQRTGRLKDRIQGMARFGNIIVQKNADSSTSAWFSYAHSSNVIPTVEIEFLTTSSPSFTYQTFKLTNAFVSHFSQEHAQIDDHPQELLILAYETVQISYIPRGVDNLAGSPSKAGYDLAQAVKV